MFRNIEVFLDEGDESHSIFLRSVGVNRPMSNLTMTLMRPTRGDGGDRADRRRVSSAFVAGEDYGV